MAKSLRSLQQAGCQQTGTLHAGTIYLPITRAVNAHLKNSSDVLTPASSQPAAEVLIVDDHPMTRFGIIQMLKNQPDLLVHSEASNTSEALEIIVRRPIVLVIADISLPGRNGLELIKDALAVRPQLKILICTMHDEMLYGHRALKAGARGFIMKDEGGQALLRAVRDVLRGEIVASRRLTEGHSANLMEQYSPYPAWVVDKLSDRELEIFTCMGRGRRTSDIAALLNLSIKTVDTHRANMREKLGLPNGTALAYYAMQWINSRV